MPYEIQWALEGRIIYMRDYGVCTLPEMEVAVEQLNQLLDEGTSPVHIIHDNRDVEKYPVSIQAIKPIVKKHPNTGWLILIEQSKVAKFITYVLATLVRQKSKEANSVEEALTILQKQDPTLPETITFP